MRAFGYLRDLVFRCSICKAAANLANVGEDEFFKGQADRVLKVLGHAQENVSGYRKILHDRGIAIEQIQSILDFKQQIPVLDKQTWFGRKFSDICVGSRIPDIAAFYSSSGQTGLFSLGTETHSEQRKAALSLEFALQHAFRAVERRTLLINCLPMGVRIHTRTIPIAETSVREDVVIALMKAVAPQFEQIILLGEHLFLKHLIEEGVKCGVDWKLHRIHVVTGAEFVPEGFRTYIAGLLGIEPANREAGSINVNYGLSELSPSIGYENWHTIQLRRHAYESPEFAEEIFGEGRGFNPCVLQYNPQQFYLETIDGACGRPELVVTVLDRERCIPMIRYNTGDQARTVSHADLAKALDRAGRPDLIPPVRLPIVLVWGKARGVQVGSEVLFPEQIKEAIYCSREMCSRLTGNFRVDGESLAPLVKFQLRDGEQPEDEVAELLKATCLKIARIEIEVRVLEYREFAFGIRHDFERKNRYL